MDTATAIAAAVNAGELDPVELVEQTLRLLEGERLNAVTTIAADRALARAGARPRGPLAGVPLLVKDLFDTAGVRTTYGSRLYAEHVPDATAPAVARLEAAGAIVVGKANLHEFAWGTTSNNPWFGAVHNPVHPGRVAGGSSGGNAAALAAGLCALGLGTDTGGSVRIPAACCEVVGYKPGYGAIPLDGCFPLSPSLDTAGPLARTVADCALASSVLTGRPLPEAGAAGLRVGLLTRRPALAPGEPRTPDDRARPLAERLAGLGARVEEVELPVPRSDVTPHFLFEAAQTHGARFRAHPDDYGADLRAKLAVALAITEEQAAAARAAIAEWAERVRALGLDLVVSPTLALDELPAEDAFEPDVRSAMTAYTRPFNNLGWPSLALGPLQLSGPVDETVLAAGLALERAG